MLLEFVQWGIREGCSVVHLGRTALDIKASLGAEPTRLVIHQRSASPPGAVGTVGSTGKRTEAGGVETGLEGRGVCPRFWQAVGCLSPS